MKKTSLFLLLFVTAAGFFACKTPEIAVDPSLHAPGMTVKGRNGFRIGQVLGYGEFTTGKVRRGWMQGYDVPFLIRFRGAKEKMSYTQHGPQNTLAEVACVSRFKSTEIELVRDYFYLPLDLQNYFAGTVLTNRVGNGWDFILYNPNGDFLRDDPSAGYVQNGDEKIEIVAVRDFKDKKQPEWLKKLTVYGFEFRKDNKVLGAVSTMNKGKVWIDPSLDASTQTVIAAVSTGILLRTDLETDFF